MTNEHPKRRWYQFRLRTLLLLTLVVSIICAVAVRVQRNRQQRLAVHAIWRMGGLTADGPGEMFRAPFGELDWAFNYQATWYTDLFTAPSPYAILYEGPFLETDTVALAATIRRIPSVEKVVFAKTSVTPEWIEALRGELPRCEVFCQTDP